jgi:hypothetical protein
MYRKLKQHELRCQQANYATGTTLLGTIIFCMLYIYL